MKIRLIFVLIFSGLLGLAFNPMHQGDVPARPTIRIDAGGQLADEPIYSYCWPIAVGNNQCDFALEPAPSSPLTVDQGQAVTVIIDNSPGNPVSLEVRVSNVQGTQAYELTPAPQAIFQEDLPPGMNRLEVVAQYANVANTEGYVTFVFELNVLAPITPTAAKPTPIPTATTAPTLTPVPTEAFAAVTEEPTEEIAEDTVATEEPTEEVTEEPITTEEVAAVTEEPTEEVTEEVTEEPTEVATEEPTEEITEEPTEEATEAPVATEEAAAVTEAPTEAVTEAPTEEVSETAEASETAETGTVSELPSQQPPPSADRPTLTTVPLVEPNTTEVAIVPTATTVPLSTATPIQPPTALPIVEPEQPPNVQLSFAGQIFNPSGVNFCQTNASNQRICVDNPLSSDGQDIALLQNFAVQIRLDGPRPAEIRFAFLDATTLNVVQSETRPGDRLILFNINVPPGRYFLRVSINWNGTDAEYFFRVRVG